MKQEEEEEHGKEHGAHDKLSEVPPRSAEKIFNRVYPTDRQQKI